MEDNAVGKALAGAFLFIIYFLPALIAKGNKHPRLEAIGLLNLFLGWTVLGWIGALIWGISKPTPVAPPVVVSAKPLSVADELAKLNKLHDDGKLTNIQYLKLKDDLINKGHA